MNDTTATPRAMKQPRKHVLRDALRDAADRIEAIARERGAWRELAEREPQDSTPFPALTLLLIGVAVGFVIGLGLGNAAGWLA